MLKVYQHIVEFYLSKAERYRKDGRWLDRYLYFSGVVHRYKQMMLNGMLSWALAITTLIEETI